MSCDQFSRPIRSRRVVRFFLRPRFFVTIIVAGCIGTGSSHWPTATRALDAQERSTDADGGVTRADLAAAYLRLELAYFADPPDGERAAKINKAFDRATLAFFTGRNANALRIIDDLTHSLGGAAATPARRAAASLKVLIQPAVWSLKKPSPATARVVSLYETPFAEPAEMTLQLRLLGPDGKPALSRDFSAKCGPGAPVDLSLPLEITADGLTPGSYRVELGTAGEAGVPVGRFNVVSGPPLDEQRATNEAKLNAVSASTPQLAEALATCRARNALLNDRPSVDNSAQFLANLDALAHEVRKEIDTLASGTDPYIGRLGDYWRVFTADDAQIPLRVYAPQAAARDKPLPLLIVLHGAGGDENMFLEAYGAGIIKQIADQHGLLVASPVSNRIGRNAGRARQLIDALGRHYAIDRDRVYVLGHSMGAGVTARLVQGAPELFAAACCIAGGSRFQSPDGIPPLKVILAELDVVVPVKRVTGAADKAIAAGMPVEMQIVPNYGHTLVVGKTLPEAVQWLLQRGAEERPVR